MDKIYKLKVKKKEVKLEDRDYMLYELLTDIKQTLKEIKNG